MSILIAASPSLERTEQEQPSVQFDLANMAPGSDAGRVKQAPVCIDETLRAEAMSTEDLSKLCFPLQVPSDTRCTAENILRHQDASVVSSSSSTASSTASASVSESEGVTAAAKVQLTPLRLERRQSEMNLKVTNQKISRSGRQTQRWFTDPSTHRVCRMVTGCVPIMKGGKILFVSASRKSEWILPKGGWETDEALEESAIRECFEEAGVLGILGPRLAEIEYETRKAKKRRLEREAKPKEETPKAKTAEETSSVSSDASTTHSHVRMTLLPLYVSEVKSDWPECGRFRKAVDIDEAMRLCESRPEFLAAIKEVKERNLHHLQEDGPAHITDR